MDLSMRYLHIILIFISSVVFAQKDFSSQWQDLYSYNNVKDFTIVGNKLVAITENAMFRTDLDDNSSQKFSSVNGLSGSITSSVGFDGDSGYTLIGYESGMIELVSPSDDVYPVTGIKDNLILVTKSVKGFYAKEGLKFAYGDFGIVELNVENTEFGDSYKLSTDGLATLVNEVAVLNSVLYAATAKGLYSIDLNSGLSPVNFNNWTQIVGGSIENIIQSNGNIYFSIAKNIYSVDNPNTALKTTSGTILDLSVDDLETSLTVTMTTLVELYDVSTFTLMNQIKLSEATSHTFTTSKAILKDNSLFVNTSSYGVLTTSLDDKTEYLEIHPDGPSENNALSISVYENQTWLTYGGFSPTYDNLKTSKGVDFFDGNEWTFIEKLNVGNLIDYTKAIVDPKNTNRVLVASYDKGVVELENKIYKKTWNHTNTEGIIPYNRGSSSVNWQADLIVDNNDFVWVANARGLDNLLFSKFESEANGGEGAWTTGVTFSNYTGNGGKNSGINKMFVDQNNVIFAGSRDGGVLAFNANDTEDVPIGIIDGGANSGGLISTEVFSVVSDSGNKVWIGTSIGLMVFDDYGNLFNSSKRAASKLIIEENGVAREFLGDTPVNDILIDKAGNKWFATEGAGLVYTSSDGQTTFDIFNTGNSPLPSNNVIDLELDEDTGFIYIVTDEGVLSYDSQNEPFGTEITEVVAYPNPAIRSKIGHEQITIVAKNGEGIPEGTNVKIMEVSGKLVYETNVGADNLSVGGKVVWNKKNLRGNFVVSGIYIVLLSSPDGNENTTTKIAIVN